MNLPLDHSGQVLGNWRIVRPLGVGGFGTVYEAEHIAIPGRRGAVKVLHPQMALNADIKRRFINEASAASRAEHENIVQIFDGGVTTEGTCYLVMELLSGQSLEQLLSQGPLSVPRALGITAQVAAALAAAHKLGIVHRDLKPDNIFVVARQANPEFVKVLDFGIAKLQDGSGATQAGMWMGTPPYMAPEQWQTLPDIDGRADLYSLGIILFRCLMGRRPFSAESQYAWLEAHLYAPVPELSGVRPPALVELVHGLLAKRREDRPANAEAVMHALLHLKGESPTLAAPASQPLPVAPSTIVRKKPRWPGVIGVIGFLGLLLGSGLLWHFGQRTQSDRMNGGQANQGSVSIDLAEVPDGGTPVDAAISAARLTPDPATDQASPAPSKRAGSETRKRAAHKRDSLPIPKSATQPANVPAKSDEPPGQRKYEAIY